jgi:hypothetical protein
MPVQRHGLLAGLAAAMVIAAAAPAVAQSIADQLNVTAEKIGLSGRKGPSLLQPGFGVGEYGGFSKSTNRSVRAAGVYSSDQMAATFTVTNPAWAGDVTADCKGGQGRLGLGWITFKRDGLDYVCTYGGSAPEGAEFNLAMSGGQGVINRMVQSQRAGEIRYGDVTLRVETKLIGGLPGIGGTGPTSYVFSRPDGTPVGSLQTGGLRPTFYLPKAKGAERDAVAIVALSLFFARDTGDDRR